MVLHLSEQLELFNKFCLACDENGPSSAGLQGTPPWVLGILHPVALAQIQVATSRGTRKPDEYWIVPAIDIEGYLIARYLELAPSAPDSDLPPCYF